LDSVESVSVGVLVERLGRLADARMREVCRALSVAVDCQQYAAGPSGRGAILRCWSSSHAASASR
jgi:hypothetical protein